MRTSIVVFCLFFLSVLSRPLDAPIWRQTMRNTCWTDTSCRRALIVSHGGAWTLSEPYDSFPAFKRAFVEGTDAVKGDYRVSKDQFGVVVHSSPFQFYETINCDGKRCEDLTAEFITTNCKMELTNYHFMNVSDLLSWANGRVITMFDVKRSQDLGHAINTIVQAGAQNRSFLEVGIEDLLVTVPKSPLWRQVYYLANARSLDDIKAMLDPKNAWLKPNVFMFEFDPKLVPQVANLTATCDQFRKQGFRTLTATPTQLFPSVDEQEKLFNTGIDVVYTYDTANGVIARTNIDKQRGITPP